MPHLPDPADDPRESISIFLFIYFPYPQWRTCPHGRNPHQRAEPLRLQHSDAAASALTSAAQNGHLQGCRGKKRRSVLKHETKPEPGGNAADASLSPANYQRSMGRGRHTEVLLFTCLNGSTAAPAASIGIPVANASTWKGGFL